MNLPIDCPELDIDPYETAHLLDPYPMHLQLRNAGPVVRLAPQPFIQGR